MPSSMISTTVVHTVQDVNSDVSRVPPGTLPPSLTHITEYELGWPAVSSGFMLISREGMYPSSRPRPLAVPIWARSAAFSLQGLSVDCKVRAVSGEVETD